MRPSSDTQIRWGVGVAVLAVAVVTVLAFVPDPFFRQRLFVTSFDDVNAVTRGAPVYFRGAVIGAVRSVALDTRTRIFSVKLGVRRDWRASPCSFAQIVESNPLTAPRIEVVALETTPAACPQARETAGCAALAAPAHGGVAMIGCRRRPDLFATAAAVMTQAAEVAKTAAAMTQQLQAMMGGSTKGVDIQKVMTDAATTLATVNEMSTRLNATLAPGRGDVALTMANVRRLSDHAASVDVSSVNDTLAQVKALVAQNQENVNTLLAQSAAASTETRTLLENISGSLTSTSTSLEHATANMDALSERIADDPTYALRGQRYADPPAPGRQR